MTPMRNKVTVCGRQVDNGEMSRISRETQRRTFWAVLVLGLMLPAFAWAQGVTPPPVPDAILKLPRDLSPWGMFMAADIVVKAVMVGLVFASVLTWTIWFAKAIELLAARRRLGAAIEALGAARVWADVRDLQG